MDLQAKIAELLPTPLSKLVLIIGLVLAGLAPQFPDFLLGWLPINQDSVLHLAKWLILIAILLITSILTLWITLKHNLNLSKSNKQIEILQSRLQTKAEELKKVTDEFEAFKQFHNSKPINYPSSGGGSNSWMA